MTKLGEDLILFTVDTNAMYHSKDALEYRRKSFEEYMTNTGVYFESGVAAGTRLDGKTMKVYVANWDDRDVIQELLSSYSESQFYNTEVIKGLSDRTFDTFSVQTGKKLREGAMLSSTLKKATRAVSCLVDHQGRYWEVIDEVKSKTKEVA